MITLDDSEVELGGVSVEVTNPVTPFGGVQVFGATDQPIQIVLRLGEQGPAGPEGPSGPQGPSGETGAAVDSVFTRTGDVIALAGDYSAFYADISHVHTFASITGKPTTLAGYGITDAQPLDTDLTAIASLTTTSFGRGFLTLADAAAGRTYINAQIAGSYEPALGNPSTSGFILSSTTAGVRSWIAPASGGGGTPGGATTQVQFNDAGAFGGDADLTWDKTNNVLASTGIYRTGDGTVSAPAYAFINDTATGWWRTPSSLLGSAAGSGVVNFAIGGFKVPSGSGVKWVAGTDITVLSDTAVMRNAAGVVEINNGTVGTYRDLLARNITLNGAITGNGAVPIGGTTGQVLQKNSATNYDVGWATPTGGTGGGTGDVVGPSSATDNALARFDTTTGKLIQNSAATLNDSGYLQLPAGNATTPSLCLESSITGLCASGGSVSLIGWNNVLAQFSAGAGMTLPAGNVALAPAGLVNWNNDIAIGRNASGVLEINNSTAGTYRDLKLRSLILSGGTTITISAPSSAVGNFLKDDGTWAAAGGGGGNVSNSGTPASLQYARWTDATHVSGVPASTVKTDLALTATDVGLGNVANVAQTQSAVVPNTLPTAGQILIGNAGNTAYVKNTISGSGATIALSAAGVLSISAIALASLVSSAITIGNAGSTALGGSATLDAITGFSSVGIIKRTGANAYAAAVAGTDFQAPITTPTGAIVGTTDTQTLTNKRINPRVSTSATGNTTPTPNSDTDDLYIATAMTVNMVFGAPTGTPVDGQRLLIRIKDSGTARTLGWNAAYTSSQSILPTATIAGKTITVGLIRNGQTSTWDCIAVDIEDAAFASYQSPALLNPAAVTSTTGLMAGMGSVAGGSSSITPNVSGKVIIILSGSISNAVLNAVANVKIRYGAGAPAAAPANGAAPTGTAPVTNAASQSLSAAAVVPFSISVVVTGLTVGTAYWLDAVIGNAGSSGAVSIFSAVFTAWEIP